MNRKHKALTTAIAAVLGTGTDANAMSVSAVLTSVISYSSGGSVAANLSSSTATWSYDTDSGRLSQSGGTFNARFSITSTTTLYRHSVAGLAIGGGTAATAASFACTEGNFGSNVGVSVCGNYQFGGNFTNESAVSWGPGTATTRTLGGDDMAVGPQQSVGAYNNFAVASWVGNTLVLSNATPTTGYTWTLALANTIPPPPPVPGFTVSEDLGIAYSISNLDILGTRYNVDFYCNPQIGASGGCAGKPGSDMFMGNEAGAIAAVDAINGALVSAGAEMVNNWYGVNYGGGRITVPYSATEAVVGCGTFLCDQPATGPWLRLAGHGAPDSRALVGFSLAPVPVPAAVWLFGGALLSLGALRRRQRFGAAR